MMPNLNTNSTLEAYHAKKREAGDLAVAAAKEMRSTAKSHLDDLKRLAFEYQKLTGKSLPETEVLFRPAATRASATDQKRPRRKRSALEGDYSGMSLSQAIIKSLEAYPNGAKAADIADDTGGQRPSIAVALSNMANSGDIKRVGRGLYTSA